MLLGLFLTGLLVVVLGAVRSAYNDLKTRDSMPPMPPSPPAAPEGVWPPPPRLGG